MRLAPQRRAILGHRNYQKWPESVVFSTFWLTNMLRATAACHFWTSERPKWVRDRSVFSTFWLTNMLRATAAWHFWTSERPKWLRRWGVLYILTHKCAWRHRRVAFWNIWTSKMAPGMWCFVHFDLQMCFAPQPRAIFHLSAEQLPPHPPL